MNVGILGGGLTGLTIAYLLRKDFEILEKEHECGGLCRSLHENGFTFDQCGAHIIFSKKKKPIDLMLNVLAENHVRRRRNNKIFYKQRFVKYPFENGLSELSKEDAFECLYHYLKNQHRKPSNFKEWIYHTFGEGIAEKYLIPYNEKVWKCPTEEMSKHWVEGRVPKPPLRDIIKSAIGISTEGYTHQLNFYYPATGGIQMLIKTMEAAVANIVRDFEVKRIEKENNRWVVSNDRGEKEFDHLVSTIPIFDLVDALDSVPKKVLEALDRLKYNSLITVMVGIDEPNINDYTAVYFPEKEFFPNRVGFPMNFSRHNAPEGKSSLVAEITSNKGDPIWELSDQDLLDHVIEYLHKKAMIHRGSVCYSKVVRSRYAYVVYDLGYLKNIYIVRKYISRLGIELCGRFSEFEYLNMDACVEHGMRTAKRINELEG